MPTVNIVYGVWNRTLMTCGIDRKSLFFVLGFGAVVFELTANLVAALVITAVLLPLARLQASYEPRLFSILRASRGLRPVYDPFVIRINEPRRSME